MGTSRARLIRRAGTAGLLALLALGLTACGGGGDGGTQTAGTGAGGAVSIEEALGASAGERLTVEGFVIAPDGGEVRLCAAILESYPPQCGEPSLVVEGLDLSTVDGLVHTSEPDLAQVSWTEAYVPVSGTVEDGVLTVGAPG